MKRLFGTDGIRGVAGRPPLDAATVRVFGIALAEVLLDAAGHSARVVLGRDTRESGTWLRDAIAVGLAARGAAAVDCGVISTPGLARATRTGAFDAGVMISASHNPFRDNGLKVFSGDGVKLPDSLERDIEARILDAGHTDPGEADVRVETDHALLETYVRALAEVVPDRRGIAGKRIVIDCANGSAAAFAPGLFRELGAAVEAIGCEPDGRNINLDCGSLHLDRLSEAVRDGGFDLGIAFDGDADRCLAVDARGRELDGDVILYLGARDLRRRGELRGDCVVATIMSNLWLEQRLGSEGVTLLRAPVGDKYVLEWMDERHASLGGEQSGHVIYRDLATTGDGVLTALLLLRSIADEDAPLATILDGIEPCPQMLINVAVREKPDLRTHPVLGPRIEAAESEMDGSGRVVLRYSGTEPLARVMVEGNDAAMVRAQAERLAEAIEKEIGER